MAPAACLPSCCHEEPADTTATATTSPLKALGFGLFSATRMHNVKVSPCLRLRVLREIGLHCPSARLHG